MAAASTDTASQNLAAIGFPVVCIRRVNWGLTAVFLHMRNFRLPDLRSILLAVSGESDGKSEPRKPSFRDFGRIGLCKETPHLPGLFLLDAAITTLILSRNPARYRFRAFCCWS